MCFYDLRPAAGQAIPICGRVDFLFALMSCEASTKETGCHADNRTDARRGEQRSDGEAGKRASCRATEQLTLPTCPLGIAICIAITCNGGISRTGRWL